MKSIKKIIKKLKSYLCIVLNKHKFKEWENQYGYGYTCERCETKIYTTFANLKKLLKKSERKIDRQKREEGR